METNVEEDSLNVPPVKKSKIECNQADELTEKNSIKDKSLCTIIQELPDQNQINKTTEELENNSSDPLIPTLSKRQQKKLRKVAEWEQKKKIKRQKEREKYRLKRLEAIEKGEPTRNGPSRKELKRNKHDLSKNFLKVCIDLDFDDLMIDKDVAKCVKQLLRIYTINRRSAQPAKLYFTGIQENGRIHKCLERNDGYENWDVNWAINKKYTDVLNKDEIVYLSSDSDNVLDKLDENSIYVIGGIVDHNHHKGLCLDRAEKLEMKTARLPLKEYIDMKARTVLSTVHVFEILLRVSEGRSWQESILEILPIRKGAKPKLDITSNDANEPPSSTVEIEEKDDMKDLTNEIKIDKENLINVQSLS